jgi:hypothetical protein
MTRLRGILVAAAVPLFLISACARAGTSAAGAPDASTRGSSSAYPQGGDDLVLRVDSLGGFVPAEHIVGRLPEVSVYGDGRVITNGPVPAIYPGPALPNLQVQTISPEQVRDLVRQGVAAGVRNGADFGRPNVADAPSTRVTVVSDGVSQSVTVEALSEAQANDPRLTEAQRNARKTLAKYVTTLTSLPAAEGMPSPVAYEPDLLGALARPWTEPGGEPVKSPEKAWPGPALPGPIMNQNTGTGCVMVTGSQKDQVLAAAAKATAVTPWTQDGQKWLITFRPMLPDEGGCAMLKGNR